jgi:hypothetical protein
MNYKNRYGKEAKKGMGREGKELRKKNTKKREGRERKEKVKENGR